MSHPALDFSAPALIQFSERALAARFSWTTGLWGRSVLAMTDLEKVIPRLPVAYPDIPIVYPLEEALLCEKAMTSDASAV